MTITITTRLASQAVPVSSWPALLVVNSVVQLLAADLTPRCWHCAQLDALLLAQRLCESVGCCWPSCLCGLLSMVDTTKSQRMQTILE
jgi:hypothetical protein